MLFKQIFSYHIFIFSNLNQPLSLSGTALSASAAVPAARGGIIEIMTKPKKKYWSGEVTRCSNALDLEEDVFTWKDPRKIARSLKRSAEVSTRKKAHPYQSAMSMLNFYINRAGKNLPAIQKKVLNQTKDELRKLYDRKE